jgi:hypothetical protein
MKAKGCIKTAVVSVIALVLLAGVFFIGGEVASFNRVSKSVKTLKENIRLPEVQGYIEFWVAEYMFGNTNWKSTVSFSTDGIESFFWNVEFFDWSGLGIDPDQGHIVLSGELDNPEGILFQGAGRCAVVYSLSESPFEFSHMNMATSEIVQITDRIFLFDPHWKSN